MEESDILNERDAEIVNVAVTLLLSPALTAMPISPEPRVVSVDEVCNAMDYRHSYNTTMYALMRGVNDMRCLQRIDTQMFALVQ